MTLKRVLTSLASLLLVLYAQAADIVTVTGEFTYYGSKTESRADCERAALNGARAKALAEKFGTVVTQDTYQHDVVSDRGESTYFSMLNESALKGEWIADVKEPDYSYELDSDGYYIVTCKVTGKAKEISNDAVDFVASVLRNGTRTVNADTRFRSGDDMYLYLKSPVDGYVAAFLVDDSNNVYSLLPYTNSVTGQVKVKHDKEYLFFHATSGEPEHGEVDELVMTAEEDVEHNRLYVVFSPQPFSKVVDNYAGDNLPRMLSYDSFNKWLVKCRKFDSRMGVKIMNLEIKK